MSEETKIPRKKRIESIEAEYATGHAMRQQSAVQKLKEYAKEFHASDPFFFNRSMNCLKRGITLEG